MTWRAVVIENIEEPGIKGVNYSLAPFTRERIKIFHDKKEFMAWWLMNFDKKKFKVRVEGT